MKPNRKVLARIIDEKGEVIIYKADIDSTVGQVIREAVDTEINVDHAYVYRRPDFTMVEIPTDYWLARWILAPKIKFKPETQLYVLTGTHNGSTIGFKRR